MTWRKSSRSAGNGACVEVWRRSSSCDTYGDACVEVAFTGEVLVRDSKDPAGLVLRFSLEAWEAFVVAAKAGEFDLS